MHARWVFLPVLGAHLAHAPVLRFDLFPALARPIDGGRTVRGRRLLGANKTWRGAAAMFSEVHGATLTLWQSTRHRSQLPAAPQAYPPLSSEQLRSGAVQLDDHAT